jgi:large subunit ribosomal protein L30
MAGLLKVTKTKSGIARNAYFTKVLKGMGLTRMHQSVILQDTPEIRGMIRKVAHMVVVEE